MKMLITVDGKPYHVEVQILDEPTPTTSKADPQPAPIPDHEGDFDHPLSEAAATSLPPTPPSPGTHQEIQSPITGEVLEVLVKAGDTVAVGDILFILEAVKMETNVSATFACTVAAVHVKPGERVTTHQALVTVDAD